MLNELTGLNIPCMHETSVEARCDPLGSLDSPQTMWESIFALLGLYLGMHLVSLIIMFRLSKKYE